jgi:hypothetical protein
MEVTLPVIMEKLKSLKTGIRAEVKSHMNNIRTDLINQVHAIENKMGNCVSVIREGFETQIGDLCTGQAQLKEGLEKQQKIVTSIVD